MQKKTGRVVIPALTVQREWLHLPLVIQVSVFRKRSRISSLKHSSRQKVQQAGSMEEQVLDYPSAVVLQNCWEEQLNLKVHPEADQHLHYSFLLKIFQVLFQ